MTGLAVAWMYRMDGMGIPAGAGMAGVGVGRNGWGAELAQGVG